MALIQGSGTGGGKASKPIPSGRSAGLNISSLTGGGMSRNQAHASIKTAGGSHATTGPGSLVRGIADMAKTAGGVARSMAGNVASVVAPAARAVDSAVDSVSKDVKTAHSFVQGNKDVRTPNKTGSDAGQLRAIAKQEKNSGQ